MARKTLQFVPKNTTLKFVKTQTPPIPIGGYNPAQVAIKGTGKISTAQKAIYSS